MKKLLLQALKLVGVLIFIYILSQIDRERVWETLQGVDKSILVLGFLSLFILYGAKSVRWHVLTRVSGVHSTFYTSWKIYNIGVFLAVITPGKLGELGRAVYLRKQGMNNATAISVTLIERFFDAAAVGAIAIPAIWILQGPQIAFVLAVIVVIATTLFLFLLRNTKFGKQLLTVIPLLEALLQSDNFFKVVMTTLANWFLYYMWILLMASAVGINAPSLAVMSAATLAGIVSLLPIAPSGLGTRDAALIYLLTPYGVEAEQSIALGFLMFISIVLSGIPGGIYWAKGIRFHN